MELKDVGRAVWRHRVLAIAIVLTTAVAVATGLYLSPKTYTASATVSAAASDETASAEDLNALRGTLGELSNSQDVLEGVASQLSEPRSTDQLRREISGRWVEGTILVQITVSDEDPDMAAEIANTVAEVLPLHDPSNGSFLFTTSNPAAPATTFSSPNLLLGIGVGALLALVLAVCGALLRDRYTNRIGSAAEVEEAGDAPVLAHVSPPRDPTTLPALYPGTAAADVFRTLRIALEAEASTVPVSRVVVSGVTPGEVNVWLGANLAISLASVGRRVLLVDGRIGDRHGQSIAAGPDTSGLYELLLGGDLDTALSAGPVDNLSVLPAGDWGGEPADVLLETRFSTVMAEAAARFDVVVVLAPPLDLCDDARVMAAGGSMLLAVPESGVSPRTLRQHADRVRSVGVRVLGVVLIGKTAERVPS
ncbi:MULTISPECIES: Wzz/FepE/Etk N-terminal domain-containing protein [unclassified Nocardioides]|uniref:Wzz/FepE/Etk N-terminal domain-containing protein n=1 Tax=unclassified Nocardioides TaxID=2615069 RepID=UPI000A26CFFD|nr:MULTISPECIES: Wzz/FepE/Etk N-terminal domain-containing protein [unclassified Nocardioides]